MGLNLREGQNKPRVGITSKASAELMDEIFRSGIDLGYLEALQETIDEINQEEAETPKGDTWDDVVEWEAQERLEKSGYESHGRHLLGDWILVDKKYEIDRNGPYGFAITANFDNGDIISVEYSKTTKRCADTSICYRQRDDGGPCGNLDREGDTLAYALPDEYMDNDE